MKPAAFVALLAVSLMAPMHLSNADSAIEIEDIETSVTGLDTVIVKAILARPSSNARHDETSKRRPLVVLLHDYARESDTLIPLSDELVKAGFAALRIDMRGHGQSIRREVGGSHLAAMVESNDFGKSTVDVRRFLESLRSDSRINSTRVVVLGFGVAGYVAVEVAALEPDVAGVVLVDPPGVRGDFSPGRELSILDLRPALFVTSSLPGAREQAESLAKYGPGERVIKQFESYDGGDRMMIPGSAPLSETAGWIERLLTPTVEPE